MVGNVVAGTVLCGWRLREPFSRTTVSGLVSVSRVSVCEIRLMRESPWVVFFYTSTDTFCAITWPHFLGQNLASDCCRFSALPGYRPVLGSLGSVPVPGKWPHILAHLSLNKRAHWLTKTQSIYQIYHTIATPWHGAISCVREGSRTGFVDSMCGQETRFMVSECTHKGAH